MNNFYTVSNNFDFGLSETQKAIFDWKIKHVITYMDIIKYIDENNFTFIIEINDVPYNFSLEYDKQNDWRMSFDDELDHDKSIHIKILDLCDLINETYDTNYAQFILNENIPNTNELKAKEVIYISDIIEKTVDEFDFNDDESDSSSSVTESISVSSDSDFMANNNDDPKIISDPMSAVATLISQQTNFDPFDDFEDEFNNNLYKTQTQTQTQTQRQIKRQSQTQIQTQSQIKRPTLNSIVTKDMKTMMDSIDKYNNSDDTSSINSEILKPIYYDDINDDINDNINDDPNEKESIVESIVENVEVIDLIDIDDDKYYVKLNGEENINTNTNTTTNTNATTNTTTTTNANSISNDQNNMDFIDEYDDFSSFIQEIDSTHVLKKYNFSQLKTNAYELIDKLKRKSISNTTSNTTSTDSDNKKPSKFAKLMHKTSSNSEKKESDFNTFKPEESVSIVISELKQLDKMDNIELVIENDDIYDIKLICWSDKLKTNVELNVKISMMEYPYSAPRFNIIKPMMTQNLNYHINTMDCFVPNNWNPTNSIPYIITELLKLIDKCAVLFVDQTITYSKLSNILIELSVQTKLKPELKSNDSENNVVNFQIPFVSNYGLSNDGPVLNKPIFNKPGYQQVQTWKSGTGYGSNGAKKWDIKKYLESDKYKLNKLDSILSEIITIISSLLDVNNDEQQKEEQQKEEQQQEREKEREKEQALKDIKNSCLVKYVVLNLTDNLDLSYIQTNKSYIQNLITLANILFDLEPQLFSDFGKTFKNNGDIFNMIQKMSIQNDSDIIESLIEIYNKINSFCDSIIPVTITDQAINQTTNELKSDDYKQEYVKALKPLQWDMITDIPNVCSNQKKLINKLHLCKEISVLSKSLPIDYESSIYVRVDENNMQSIHAIIIPSDDTPYAFGCYLFHIFMPETYNKTPPLVKIVTTGGGSVRFNPNLYACGKVCLSLLGTWSGDASEMWNESSTLLQVLISIQSLIFIDEPYFNEPGHERSMNTEPGKKASKEYNKNVKFNNLTWAMVDMLKKPPKGFESVIETHFKLKSNKILSEVGKWASDASNVSTFNAKFKELQNAIAKLK